jgi:hypothetical protein
VTNKRPDIVVWSKLKKALVMIDLTITWQERIENAYEKKRIEVGCRGFVGEKCALRLTL